MSYYNIIRNKNPIDFGISIDINNDELIYFSEEGHFTYIPTNLLKNEYIFKRIEKNDINYWSIILINNINKYNTYPHLKKLLIDQSIQLLKYTVKNNDIKLFNLEENDNCPICYHEFKPKQTVASFHHNKHLHWCCLDCSQKLLTNYCPLCRMDFDYSI